MCAVKVTGGAKLDAALARYLDNATLTMRAGLLEGATEPDGTPMALVGFWNEYGTDDIPPRPAFRTTAIAQASRWAKIVGVTLQRNGGDFGAALRMAGEQAVVDIQKTIGDWSDPPNAASTIAKKGFDGPLRGSAAAPMQHAVAYDIVDGAPTE
ncbi:conserved hypothetical protein [Burkholderia diffusa]|uniref:hypothetical protein n=1 Tax=Burkholderia diffusa TaxID=488732 RepID=UPI001CB18090|nr:hypothetical protein [Burkholderia diffusa]CAG9259647.1 conserved hypothetical protein [Burkholderia diffusa]